MIEGTAGAAAQGYDAPPSDPAPSAPSQQQQVPMVPIIPIHQQVAYVQPTPVLAYPTMPDPTSFGFVLQFNKCCCGCDYRSATIICAVIVIIQYAITFIGFVPFISLSVFATLYDIVAVIAFLSTICGILGLIGTIRYSQGLILVFLIWNWIQLVFDAILLIMSLIIGIFFSDCIHDPSWMYSICTGLASSTVFVLIIVYVAEVALGITFTATTQTLYSLMNTYSLEGGVFTPNGGTKSIANKTIVSTVQQTDQIQQVQHNIVT